MSPCFLLIRSVLDAGIPLLCAVISLITILGTVVYKKVHRNHSGDHSGYLPISGQEDTLAGSETDIEDQEDAQLNGSDLGQVSTGRRVSVRDAVKALAAFISLGVSIAWLVVRSNADKQSYLYLAPLVSTLAWVSFTFCSVLLYYPNRSGTYLWIGQ